MLTRARKEEQKHERRQAILDAAWRQFQVAPYDAVTVAGLAGVLGLAKGTVYLYFRTKEELFLAVLAQRLGEWFDEVDPRLEAMTGQAAAADIADLISRSLTERPGLTRLLAILSTVLEQNVDYDAALRFKQFLGARLARTGGLLEQRLPSLRPGQGARLLLRLHALIVGLQHLADAAPVVQEVLRQPGLEAFAVDFGSELSETVAALLAGLERDTRRSKWATR